MLNQVVVDAINAQINAELSASYSYLAMSAYCERTNFTGCAKWFRIQSDEEHVHAIKLFDFLLARGATVQLTALDGPRNDFGSVLEVFETAYAQEQRVTAQINQLYDIAFGAKAFDTVVQMQWFVNEQVEEEKAMREIVARMTMIKDDPASMLDMDRELGGRALEPAAEPAAT